MCGWVMVSGLVAGCAVGPDGRVLDYSEPALYVNAPPPNPYTESIPAAPYSGATWVKGYWDWAGGRHVWRPGRYEPARDGRVYQQPEWRRMDDGRWQLNRGGWTNRNERYYRPGSDRS